jgi:hypothetical protein
MTSPFWNVEISMERILLLLDGASAVIVCCARTAVAKQINSAANTMLRPDLFIIIGSFRVVLF